MAEGPATQGDRPALQQAAERFASVLAEYGWPRMPARVFAALLFSDAGGLTSAELTEFLSVSPAAISGAVRYLSQLELVGRDRKPGSRRDWYRVQDDAWHLGLLRGIQMVSRWRRALEESLDVVGEDSPAGRRMGETLAFFRFYEEEIAGLLERWEHARDVERQAR